MAPDGRERSVNGAARAAGGATRILAVCGLLGAAGGGPLGAQAGVPGGDPASGDRMRAEFRAHVLAGTDTLMRAWSDAWRRDDAEAVAGRYLDDAVVVLPGGDVLVGRDAIRRSLERGLGRVGEIQAGRGDFDASERLAYLAGPARFVVGDVAGARSPSWGSHVTIGFRSDEGWRIRLQLFRLREGQESVPISGPDGPLVRPERPDAATLDRGAAAPYFRRTYAAVTRAVGELAVTWQDGDLRGLRELFTRRGRLRSSLDGEDYAGEEALARHLPELATLGGAVHLAVLDFDASGRMAVVYGRYLAEAVRGAGGDDLTGPYVLVYRLDGDEPRIRALVLGRDAG